MSPGKRTNGFTDEERAAMRERARGAEGRQACAAGERGRRTGRATSSRRSPRCPKADRVMAKRLHAIIKENAPSLAPRTWYGMPAYADDGKVVCFFQSAEKFKSRYATLGFSDRANLDEGAMWPTCVPH